MVGRKTIAGGLAALIAASTLASFPNISSASSIVSSVLSSCSFTLENAAQSSEQVRAKCTALDNPSRHVTIIFNQGVGYAYVRERADQTLYCEVRMQKTNQQPARIGVFDCQQKNPGSEQSSNLSTNRKGKANEKNTSVDRSINPVFNGHLGNRECQSVSGLSRQLDMQILIGRHSQSCHTRKRRHDARAGRVSHNWATGRFRKYCFREVHHQPLGR